MDRLDDGMEGSRSNVTWSRKEDGGFVFDDPELEEAKQTLARAWDSAMRQGRGEDVSDEEEDRCDGKEQAGRGGGGDVRGGEEDPELCVMEQTVAEILREQERLDRAEAMDKLREKFAKLDAQKRQLEEEDMPRCQELLASMGDKDGDMRPLLLYRAAF